MKNRPFIIGLTAVITLISIYLFSFTFTAREVEADASEYATSADGKLDQNKRKRYLDSLIVNDVPVRQILGLSYTYKEIKETELALGLDLQGGMHVMLEVSPISLLEKNAGINAKDPVFQASLKLAQEKQKNSPKNYLDLFAEAFVEKDAQGKLSRIFATSENVGLGISSNSSNAEIISILNGEISKAIGGTLERLRTRIDKFGAIQPNIQLIQGTNRILVELPGVENPQRVRELLQNTAKLEFIEVYHFNEIVPSLIKANDYLVSIKKASAKKDSATTVTTPAGDDDFLVSVGDSAKGKKDSSAVAKADSAAKDSNSVSEIFSLRYDQNTLLYNAKDTSTINRIFADPAVKALLPNRLMLVWEKKARIVKGKNDEQIKLIELVACRKAPTEAARVTGDDISKARADYDQMAGEYAVSLSMKENGAAEWRKLTKAASAENPKRRVAIVMDGACYSAPTVQVEIPNGQSSITGNFTQEEANDLANILEAGKLDIPVRIVEEVTVGPSLGAESIRAGMYSIVAGLILVVVFMIFYYNRSGGVADIALVFNILFTLGAMASLPSGVVLTLPGIAGIVLTIGMAVDANVLIFERIKEELRAGKPLLTAIDLGYSKAFSSIFDSNITTLMVGAILLWLGSGPIKGFATTLIIGIACSFFTAVFISKVFLLWIVKDKGDNINQFTTAISRNLFSNLNFDIISKRKTAYIASSAILAIGLIAAIINGGLNLGVDFKGGRSYVVQFDKSVSTSELKDKLSTGFENKGTEVKTYGSDDVIKITTSYKIEDETRAGDEAVEAALRKGLTEYQGDKFTILYSNKVGATVADDIISSSYTSLSLALVGIFVYVWFRFRKWQFSLGGVTALFHDTLMCLAIFSILHLLGISYEIDQVFIAAILTIVGFSINDTVIVFDRVREVLGMQKKDVSDFKKAEVGDLINQAINFTLSRTIMTTFTVLVVVLILVIFGGESLRGFSLAMLIGVVFGSYSTIFIAVPMVVDLWKDKITPTEVVSEGGSKGKVDLKKKPVA